MTPYQIISKKRDGLALSDEEISFFINNYTNGQIPDYQMAALLMAIYLKDLSSKETKALMKAFLNSGKILSLDDIPGIKVDKHSTGGVGDKVSIILAPIVAAAGVKVPMISGRGLGHTGGTLDKLESITGFRTDYTIKQFRKKISEVGTCLIGQTPELAPADKKIYALRDVTATIQATPLIAASIMSKKLAEGIDALVLDIKTGTGAFMQNYDQAVNLAKTLISIGEDAGKQTVAYITNMNSPLGNSVGNWLEIRECIDCLQDRGPEDLMQVTYQLAGTMLFLGKDAESVDLGIEKAKNMVQNGAAWEKFLQIVKSQGGNVELINNPETYSSSKYQQNIVADKEGWVQQIDALEVGLCALLLGAGRQTAEDKIDFKAGIVFHKKVADKVKRNEKLFTVYGDKKDVFKNIIPRLTNAIIISQQSAQQPEMILEFLDKSSL